MPKEIKLADILASMGIDRSNLRSMRRDPSTIKAYLELHIEQGPILEAQKKAHRNRNLHRRPNAI
jgi:hypothetical protein